MRDFVQVTGGGNCTIAVARDAMRIDWMTKSELNEAIPPAPNAFKNHLSANSHSHRVRYVPVVFVGLSIFLKNVDADSRVLAACCSSCWVAFEFQTT